MAFSIPAVMIISRLNIIVSTISYHDVTNNPMSTGFPRKSALPYKHSVEEFAQNLAEIAKAPRRPSLVQNLDLESQNKYLLLTFDDGGKSSMYIADEIEKYGWKGHFFIPTGMIGMKTFLSKTDILQLHQRGHVIGAHSHNHPDIFSVLPYDEMLKEWQSSVAILSDIVNERVVCASIPNGDMNLNAQLSAQAAGIRFLFTSEPLLVPWRLNTLVCFGRVCPKSGAPVKRIYSFVRNEGYFQQRVLHVIKNIFKKVYYPLKNMH